METGWSLGFREWGELASASSNLNVVWKEYRFEENAIRILPKQSGVYAITVQSPVDFGDFSRKNNYVVYIGRARNLRNRLSQHYLGATPVRDSISNFPVRKLWVAKVDEKSVDSLEALLIRAFKPPINQVQPAIRGILGEEVAI